MRADTHALPPHTAPPERREIFLLHTPPPPGVPEPRPPCPPPHQGKPSRVQNPTATHGKTRRGSSAWCLCLAEPRLRRLPPRPFPSRRSKCLLIPSCGLKRRAGHKAYVRPGRMRVGQGYKLPFIRNFIVLRAMHTLSLEVSVITLFYIIEVQRH